MTDLDLDVIRERAAIRPGALLAALRCVPNGEFFHGCVVSDGTRTKDAIRAAFHVVHRDVPALIAEVERLRNLAEKAKAWRDVAVLPRNGELDWNLINRATDEFWAAVDALGGET